MLCKFIKNLAVGGNPRQRVRYNLLRNLHYVIRPIMTDTTPEMRKMQAAISAAMTPQERFMQGIEMMDYVKMVVENSIKAQNPNISETELKVAVFIRYYKKNFTPERLADIIAWFRASNSHQ